MSRRLLRAGGDWLLLEGDRIGAAGQAAARPEPTGMPVTDLGGARLAPGFIDVHVHGGAGHDFMRAGAAEMAAVGRHLARHGVTAFLATTVTANRDETRAALARLAAAAATPPAPGAAVALGLHLEGPFLSPRQRGVHPEADLRLPTLAEWQELQAAAGGAIRWLTIAPELEGALEVIAAAATHGVVVSLGHSDGTAAEARAAWAAGARHVTHTFNAMRPLHHRDPPLLAEALVNDGLSAEIIADGEHVAPGMVELFLRLKGMERAVLASDGISAAGCGDGRYRLGGIEVEVEGGRCRAGGRLAGSMLTLDRAVRNVVAWTGRPLGAVVGMATRNPARLLGVGRGELAAGAPADVVAIDAANEVSGVWVRGEPLVV